MAQKVISRMKVKGEIYDIKAMDSYSADEAKKTIGKLTIGDNVFDGSEDIVIPVYQGNDLEI